jgi:hypothetical protein
MRKIKVMAPNKVVSFESHSNTWGDLKDEIVNDHGIPLSNMVSICAQNKMKFELDSTKLPVFEGENDLTILIVQGKSEKGAKKSWKKKVKKILKLAVRNIIMEIEESMNDSDESGLSSKIDKMTYNEVVREIKEG